MPLPFIGPGPGGSTWPVGMAGTPNALNQGGGLPDWLSSTVKGINQNVTYSDFTATDYGITPGMTSAMTAAGYNALRVFVPLQTLMTAYGVDTPTFNAAVATAVAFVRNVYSRGFRPAVTWSDSPALRLSVMNPGSPEKTAYKASCVALGAALDAAFGGSCLFELMNEPPDKSTISGAGYSAYASVFMPEIYAAVQAVATRLKLGVMSTGFGNPADLADLAPADFPGAIYTYHMYNPGEFTHQGQTALWGHIDQLPWPVNQYLGGIAVAKSDMSAKVNADGGLTSPQKTALISANNTRIANLFTSIGSRRYVESLFATLEAWRVANSIPANRIGCTEFGVVSEFNYDGTAGTYLTARNRYIRDARKLIDSYGHFRLSYGAVGDLNHFVQSAINTHTSVMIPELLAAEAMVHAGPDDITISGQAILQSALVGDTIATLAAFGGSGSSTFAIASGGDPDSKFTVTSAGVVKLAATVSRATKKGHSLTVTATDAAGATHTKRLDFPVVDYSLFSAWADFRLGLYYLPNMSAATIAGAADAAILAAVTASDQATFFGAFTAPAFGTTSRPYIDINGATQDNLATNAPRFDYYNGVRQLLLDGSVSESFRLNTLVEAITNRAAATVVARRDMMNDTSQLDMRIIGTNSNNNLAATYFNTSQMGSYDGSSSLVATSGDPTDWTAPIGVVAGYDGTNRKLCVNGGAVASVAGVTGTRTNLFLGKGGGNTNYGKGRYDFFGVIAGLVSDANIPALAQPYNA